jgi:hypothetical protein
VVTLSSQRAIAADEAKGLFDRHLPAVERLVEYVDRWSAP